MLDIDTRAWCKGSVWERNSWGFSLFAASRERQAKEYTSSPSSISCRLEACEQSSGVFNLSGLARPFLFVWRYTHMDHILITGVGLLLSLWFLWRSSDLSISYLRSHNTYSTVFGIGYGLLAVLFLIVCVLALRWDVKREQAIYDYSLVGTTAARSYNTVPGSSFEIVNVLCDILYNPEPELAITFNTERRTKQLPRMAA